MKKINWLRKIIYLYLMADVEISTRKRRDHKFMKAAKKAKAARRRNRK